jgi:putative colanic acid biosynthesis acetyltransferase WcaF
MTLSSDVAAYDGPSFSFRNRAARASWNIVYVLLFRLSPRPFHGWRRFLLRVFGAQVGRGCHVYPKAIIWAPWNLTVGEAGAIADGADVYNPSPITIGAWAVVSQGAYLCGASHDYTSDRFPLTTKPIVVRDHAWVAARAIVQMGVTIGDGCVIGAGSVVTRDMPAWMVCAGNPCRPIKPFTRTGTPAVDSARR